MAGVKRLAGACVLILIAAAVTDAFLVTRRERAYRQLVDQGEAALARDDTATAVSAFGGAIALKSDSMLGYLKRGEAYHRRGELEPARQDLLRASELDPLAPRPLELLGDANFALGRFGRR